MCSMQISFFFLPAWISVVQNPAKCTGFSCNILALFNTTHTEVSECFLWMMSLYSNQLINHLSLNQHRRCLRKNSSPYLELFLSETNQSAVFWNVCLKPEINIIKFKDNRKEITSYWRHWLEPTQLTPVVTNSWFPVASRFLGKLIHSDVANNANSIMCGSLWILTWSWN